MGGFGMPDPLLANKGGDWVAGYRACLQVLPCLASLLSWPLQCCQQAVL